MSDSTYFATTSTSRFTARPTAPGVKAAVQQAGARVAVQLNTAAAQVDTLQVETRQRLESAVAEVNEIARENQPEHEVAPRYPRFRQHQPGSPRHRQNMPYEHRERRHDDRQRKKQLKVDPARHSASYCFAFSSPGST